MSSTVASSCEFQSAGKQVASPVYLVDTNGNPKVNGANATPVAAGTSADTVIKAAPGVFYGVLVTTSAAGTPTVYDNATTHSGTIISMAPASTIGFTATPSIGVATSNGITVAGSASNPAMTVYWS